jgi:hypothetical protein
MRGRCISNSLPGQGEHSDVVVLPEVDGGLSDGLCSGAAELEGALKAEEVACGVAGFDDAVGKKGEGLTAGRSSRNRGDIETNGQTSSPIDLISASPLLFVTTPSRRV